MVIHSPTILKRGGSDPEPGNCLRLQRLSRAGVPQPDRRVPRCRRQLLAVRREGHGADPFRMALERMQQGIPVVPNLR
ncbi:hypothetical protein EJ06DRAFT_527018 [Trichodelitschia bisporula]|uniref:Uncharacterized protein n=1 Tax=Trichodelitschia bisporula TaxID=703511 RepID=A0A6G1I5E2_9PEZI|nr:hypothetical protein EJ06DRAFT_527018 [Trichodelitschia bisporula]